VLAAIRVKDMRVGEREVVWAERINASFLLKKDKTVLQYFSGTAHGFIADFWENPAILSRVYV
jgi:hypothetical protein